jgi:ArsR family transcriptional regulator, arsenate/arsenite/antimonite-responsive transcriptional repressor
MTLPSPALAPETSLTHPSRLFGALSDPARLRILNLIRHGRLVCNCEIGPITGYIPSKISRHLTLLKQAGLLTETRSGTFIRYALAKPTDPLTRRVIALIDLLASADPLLQADRAALDNQACCV